MQEGALGAERGRRAVRGPDSVAAVRGGRALLLGRSQVETGQAASGLEMRDGAGGDSRSRRRNRRGEAGAAVARVTGIGGGLRDGGWAV